MFNDLFYVMGANMKLYMPVILGSKISYYHNMSHNFSFYLNSVIVYANMYKRMSYEYTLQTCPV